MKKTKEAESMKGDSNMKTAYDELEQDFKDHANHQNHQKTKKVERPEKHSVDEIITRWEQIDLASKKEALQMAIDTIQSLKDELKASENAINASMDLIDQHEERRVKILKQEVERPIEVRIDTAIEKNQNNNETLSAKTKAKEFVGAALQLAKEKIQSLKEELELSRNNEIGLKYDIDQDLEFQDSQHEIIQKQESQIKELRKGIEKRLIAFSDWTMENEDSPNYVAHQDVKDYLSNF